MRGRGGRGRGTVRGTMRQIISAQRVPSVRRPVLTVQLVRTVHGAVVLIIRRSWVRAPPAPPSLSCGDTLFSGPCDRAPGPLSGPDGRKMTTPAYQRERGRLAEALKALRVGAGLSGARLAEMLGWQQSKVSKIETRRQLPSRDDIAAWASAVGARPRRRAICSRCFRARGRIRAISALRSEGSRLASWTRVSGYFAGWRRGEGAEDGGRSAGDQARAPGTGGRSGPHAGLWYGARREIGSWQRAMWAGVVR